MRRTQRSDRHYGDRADTYHRGRKDYPKELMDCIVHEVDGLGESAADVGCGTGVATRQLNRYWKMTGVDHDPRMLKIAHYAQRDIPQGARERITYQLARADKLLKLGNESQHLVTCFSSFHNFPTRDATREFKRVLRKKGYVAIVHQESCDRDLFRVAWRSVVAGYIGEVPKRHKEIIGYDPEAVQELLDKSGFEHVRIRTLRSHYEEYSIDEAMARVLPMTYWKAIPTARQSEAEKALRLAFEGLLPKGKSTITRCTNAWAVIGRKPAK